MPEENECFDDSKKGGGQQSGCPEGYPGRGERDVSKDDKHITSLRRYADIFEEGDNGLLWDVAAGMREAANRIESLVLALTEVLDLRDQMRDQIASLETDRDAQRGRADQFKIALENIAHTDDPVEIAYTALYGTEMSHDRLANDG